jgi:hypothetical protein
MGIEQRGTLENQVFDENEKTKNKNKLEGK